MSKKHQNPQNDIVEKIKRLLDDETGATTTGDVAINTSGKSTSVSRRVSSIGYECPKGQVWDKETRMCVPKKSVKETTIVGGTYGNSNTTIAGSGQTRAVGDYRGSIDNLNKILLKFNSLLGIYVPEVMDDIPEDEV